MRQDEISNKILKALKPQDFDLIAPFLERVDVATHFNIAKPGESLEYVYFPESGIGTVMAVAPDGRTTEAGMFGREGFVPSSTIIGDNVVPYFIEMNVSGTAYKLSISAMREATLTSPTLQIPLISYLHVFACQVAYTSLANAKFTLEERLARWLLMCHDRLQANEMDITHNYIALLVGVRRPGITTALHVLEGEGLIRSTRGIVTIRNRKGLEALAGGSYGIPEREYDRLIGR
ncbi:Crp/Fnr family transcriptional regulator [Rhizobium sp. S163]|uniref:Crp/Fnr family transcriptional regulator n=1 Tax=Rhizobium sp. S163 TaxID=3055039 RepID=UPI0025A963ED|nr:Crp/Fnr family transcriptional regulator [Rhizobium sp. S163]MDM9646818.1 Crp/Fnr family transcriptional regulator [Rhizobium sp. S163]